ncbi:MAG: ATP-binding protein [Hyphomonadaceae bacterium]
MKRIAQLARDTRQKGNHKIADEPSSREGVPAPSNSKRLFGLSSSNQALVLPMIAATCLAGVAAAAVGLGLQYRSQLDWVRHTEEVRGNLSEAFSLVQDAELGRRGYMLTGDEAYARHTNEARIPFDNYVKGLEALVADNADQQAALFQFRDLAIARFAIPDTGGATRRPDGGADSITSLDAVRTVAQSMLRREESFLQQRQAEAAGTGGLLMLTALVALLLAGLSLTIWMLDRRKSATNSDDRVTESGEAAFALKESRDQTNTEVLGRAALEDQIHQLQKMEAVGQLTGGIAHDFNNMNAVVMSAISLCRRRLARGETDIGSLLDAAMDAAKRSAALTTRLLAFSRQQQLLPEVLDPSQFVSGMTELLRRTLGENIVIETVLGGGLWRTTADPSQLENVILNLCVNARDAMPDGGRLTLETANVSLDDAYSRANIDAAAGQYVMIAVTDNGEGMPPEVIKRAFEPFYTTKPLGEGTGLGLSQVFGFVKQSGGNVKIYSELGKGTTIKIYLPRYTGDKKPASAVEPHTLVPRGSVGEIVLVVEDEKRLRELTVAGLRELGYTIIHAEDGASALLKIDQHPEIDCLFTDIIMPGMSGRQLADEAMRRRPDLKVLFTTGYARESVIHNQSLALGVNFIPKPYTLDDLALKMRSVLSGPPVAPAA